MRIVPLLFFMLLCVSLKTKHFIAAGSFYHILSGSKLMFLDLLLFL